MITSRTIAIGILKAFAIIIFFGVFIYFTYSIRYVFLYLIISLIFTLIANPIVTFLNRKFKFSNTLATITTLSFLLMLIVSIGLIIVPLILSQSDNLQLLNTNEIKQNFYILLNDINVFLHKYNIESTQLFSKDNFIEKLNFEYFTSFFNSFISLLSNIGIGMFSVLFISFFFLKDKKKFIIAAKAILPDRYENEILNSIDKINELLSRYFIGLLIQILIIFILDLIVLIIFGVENALLIALLCAILNIIPYLGPIIATFIAVVLTMLNHVGEDFQTEMLPKAIYVIIGYTVVQVIDNNISQPIIFSNSVKSHPLEIFLIILISGVLFGITGMIIAVPTYTIIKVIAKEFYPENKIIKILTKNI